MDREGLKSIPLYPEGRACPAPTTEKILEAFDRIEVHQLRRDGGVVQVFGPELTTQQKQLLRLAGVSETVYTA